ncbi:molybdopterin-guanine dinucleotide biosynthesis protein A [Halogranum gelatinilyticum]|uniref:Probable molybdenum cofactor guanylyltransferase n=1 Tax=Halogranum gelatinilyticum TaxID=660521 RepID=A0A1G9YLB1_9EURY|nr:molybdenum cofactor guanylyltransferase [Halogranum gelatinilyticum]SDN09914.1 molybdopterin-guanine dinucleotide biosynthesis protein A [Halogranum gelatinilyticum]
MTPDDVTAVVLAGGESSRFGDEPKATARLGGRPLVERVVDRVRTATGRPPVVAAGSSEKRAVVDGALPHRVRYAEDADWCGGPLAGICGALAQVSTSAVFVCGCDVPLVSPRVVSWLAERHAATAADATVPVDADGEPQLLHAVYRTAALEGYCERTPDDHRLRAVVDGCTTEAVSASDAPDGCPLGRSTTNVNTRRELVAAARVEDDTCDGQPRPWTDERGRQGRDGPHSASR